MFKIFLSDANSLEKSNQLDLKPKPLLGAIQISYDASRNGGEKQNRHIGVTWGKGRITDTFIRQNCCHYEKS